MLPRHVALKVPEPDVPLICVTLHLKFTHASASEPDEPGSDWTVAQVPPSVWDVLAVTLVGLVLVLKSKHAAPAAAAATARSIVRARCFISSYNYRSMAILKVALMGHPVLRAKALPVSPGQITSAPIQHLIDDMFETMREYAGIGLAAPQVHEGLRVFVAGVRALADGEVIEGLHSDEDMPFITMINPEVTLLTEPEFEGWEGCLSIPDIRGLVPRAAKIQVRAYDRTGARVTFAASGLPARVIQHETDHLDGVLFFDRMRSLESLSFMDEYRRYWTENEEEE